MGHKPVSHARKSSSNSRNARRQKQLRDTSTDTQIGEAPLTRKYEEREVTGRGAFGEERESC
jgi:hypothetical protein